MMITAASQKILRLLLVSDLGANGGKPFLQYVMHPKVYETSVEIQSGNCEGSVGVVDRRRIPILHLLLARTRRKIYFYKAVVPGSLS